MTELEGVAVDDCFALQAVADIDEHFDDVCGELIGGPAGSFYLRAVLQLPDSSKREAVLRVLPKAE